MKKLETLGKENKILGGDNEILKRKQEMVNWENLLLWLLFFTEQNFQFLARSKKSE